MTDTVPLPMIVAGCFLIIQAVNSTLTCVHEFCLSCDIAGQSMEMSPPQTKDESCVPCFNIIGLNSTTTNASCLTQFIVYLNASSPYVTEGADMHLTCVHNMTLFRNVYKWYKNGQPINKADNAELTKQKMTKSDTAWYRCEVQNVCGNFTSDPVEIFLSRGEPESVLVIVICLMTAAGFILMFMMIIKCLLRRETGWMAQNNAGRLRNINAVAAGVS